MDSRHKTAVNLKHIGRKFLKMAQRRITCPKIINCNPITHGPQFLEFLIQETLQLEIAKEMLERNGVSCTTCSNAKELVNDALALYEPNNEWTVNW